MLRRIDFCWFGWREKEEGGGGEAQEKDDQLEPVMDKRGGSMGRGEGSKERERKRERGGDNMAVRPAGNTVVLL